MKQFFLGVDLGHVCIYQIYSVLFPEVVLVGLGMLKLHMAHIHIHQSCSGEKVLGFCGNNGDFFVGKLSNVPCSGYTCNSISNNDNVFRGLGLIVLCVEVYRKNLTER